MTRIRFKYRIVEPANGDHPAFLMAPKGGEGVLVKRSKKKGKKYPCTVRWDKCPHDFLCSEDEFEVIEW